MSGSDAAVTANGPLMARDARISQRARGVDGTIAPLTRAFAVERVTRIELAWPAWKESARLPEPTRMRLLVWPPCTARHHHRLWLRAREGPGVRLLFDLMSSCSGLLKRAAATTPTAVTVITLTFNVLQRPCAEAAMGGRDRGNGHE